ncbi:hypothetical protein, partial [Pseudomonas aeruginosa]|uniref:hypothetical protein n=1 Tax=Pseudomonas aeruginosa TaxID=287 RepID=UPI003457048E
MWLLVLRWVGSRLVVVGFVLVVVVLVVGGGFGFFFFAPGAAVGFLLSIYGGQVLVAFDQGVVLAVGVGGVFSLGTR